MNKSNRIIVLSVSLFAVALIDLIFNPFWPIWGEAYKKEYHGGYITNQPSNLSTFLNDSHYSFFQHFCSIFSLISLYITTLLIIVALLVFLIKKKNLIVIDYLLVFLLVIPTIFLPFTCNFSTMPFVFYCFLPLAIAIMLAVFKIMVRKKEKQSSDVELN